MKESERIEIEEGEVVVELPPKFKVLKKDNDYRMVLLGLPNGKKVKVTFEAMEAWLGISV